MGANESKQGAEEGAGLLAQYPVTGDPRVDQPRALELKGKIRGRYAFPLRNQLQTRVRQLDPRNPSHAHEHAYLCHNEAMQHPEPTCTQLWAQAEQLWALTIRLGAADYGHYVHKSWAEAVIKQGPHRKADELAILERIKQIPRSPDEDREDAKAARGKGDWAKAVELYRTAHSKSEGHDDLIEIARCLVIWKTLNDDEAIQACREALEKNGTKAAKDPYHTHEAREEQERRDGLAAIIAAAPHYQAAIRHEQRGDFDRAAEAGRRAMLAYESFQTCDLQSKILLKAKRWIEAERVIRDSYHQRAKYSSHESRLAVVYFKERRYLMAINLLEKMERDGLSEERLIECRARQVKYRKSQEQAHKTALGALNNPNTDATELANWARFFYFEREFAPSITTMERALEMDPSNAMYHGNLADALWANKACDKAKEHYKQARDLDPNDLQALVWDSRIGMNHVPAEEWGNILKWDPCAQNFGGIGLTFRTGRQSGCEDAFMPWQAEEALANALRLEPRHSDAAMWKERLDCIKNWRGQVTADVDQLRDKTMANWYYNNRAYNVLGSTNQYTLQYAAQSYQMNGVGS